MSEGDTRYRYKKPYRAHRAGSPAPATHQRLDDNRPATYIFFESRVRMFTLVSSD